MKDEIKPDEFYDQNLARLQESFQISNNASFYRRKYREASPKETAEEALLKLKSFIEPFAVTETHPDIDTLFPYVSAFVKAYEREHPEAKKSLRHKA